MPTQANAPLQAGTGDAAASVERYDAAAAQAARAAIPSSVRALGGAPAQLRRDIRAARRFAGKGTLSLAFEERVARNHASVGEYGTIRFDPDPAGEQAESIDLVQVASLRTNRSGQDAHLERLLGGGSASGGARTVADEKEPASAARGSGASSSVAVAIGPRARGRPVDAVEDHLETSGTPAVKDLWRIEGAEGFHIDLTGDALRPRRSARDPESESAYNAERRGTGGRPAWENPLDEVSVGLDPRTRYLEPYPQELAATREERTREAARGGKELRVINQQPGYNRGGGDLREAELFDFPQSSQPSIFRFQTMVEADRRPWGTARWGFTVVQDPRDESLEVDTVDPVEFVAGSTPQLRLAQRNFDDIMGNRRGYTAPERLAEARALLDAGAPSRLEATELLAEMRDALTFAIERISASRDRGVRNLYLPGHVDVANSLLPLLEEGGVSAESLDRALERILA